MSKDRIGVGLIGAGANTRWRHIPGFHAIEGVELVAVANRTLESGQKIASEFGIPRVSGDWQDVIADPEVDAICIGTWPYMHCPMVLAALENDKHVLTEARMAMDADEARAMLAASRKCSHLVAQIVPSRFTFPVDQMIQDLLEDGYVGELLTVELTIRQGSFIDHETPMNYRYDRDLSGFNIMTLGIWYEALMRWIGPASSVLALTRTHVKRRKLPGGSYRVVTIPDHVEVLCEFASGPIGHLRFTSVTGLAPADHVWLFGSQGTLMLEVSTMTLHGGRRGDDRLTEIPVPAEKRGSWQVEEEFINAVRGLEPIRYTRFEDGVRYMEFTEAVTRSAQTGARIALPL